MPELQVFDTEAVKTEERLRFTGTFSSKELEQQYRKSRLEESLSTAGILLAVTTVGLLVFISSDYRLFGTAMPFPVIVAVRLGLCVLSVFAWIKLRSAVRVQQPRLFNRALLSWGVIVALAQVYVSFTRPANYTGHFLVHLFTILITYCIVPLPLLLQAIPALLMSIGMITCMTLKTSADGLTSRALMWPLLAGNVLGASISRQLHRSGRLQFLALERETQMRVGLEAALAELNTLRGIIPICSHCKNIRDDAGSWHQLEEYICNHSGAEFSHGICPTCVGKFFS